MKLAYQFILCLTCMSAPGATYYVATDGNDAAAGSIGAPWLRITNSLPKISGGDTLNIRSGTYGEYISDLIPAGSSWSSPTTLQAYNGETVTLNPVTPDGFDVIRIVGSSRHHIVINGLILDGRNLVGEGCTVKGTYSVAGAPAQYVRFTNCIIRNANDGHNVLLSGGGNYVNTYWEFLNCTVTGAGYSGNPVGSGDHGFYLHAGGNVIDGCTIYSNQNRAIQIYNNNPSGNIIRNCTFPGGPENVVIYDGDTNQIINNVFYNNPVAVGIAAAGLNTGNLIANNTFYSNGISVRLYVSPGYQVGNTTIENNLCSNPSGSFGAITVEEGAATNSTITIRNNVIAGVGLSGRIDNPDNHTLSNNLTNQASAGFADVGAFNFALTASSPAIDAGINSFVTTDRTSGTRGHPPDAGAYEYYPSSVSAGTATIGRITTP